MYLKIVKRVQEKCALCICKMYIMHEKGIHVLKKEKEKKIKKIPIKPERKKEIRRKLTKE